MRTTAHDIAGLARKTENRGSVHVFLGDPAAAMCDTTTVEPGNGYSPGIWTCGISLWFETGGEIVTPDLLPESKIRWGFGEEDHGVPPVLRARYRVGEVHVTHDLCHLGAEGAEGVDFNRVALASRTAAIVTCHLVVKEAGPAGGQIRLLRWDESAGLLQVNAALRLIVEAPEVHRWRVLLDEPDGGSPVAVLSVGVDLDPESPLELRFRSEHDFQDRAFGSVMPQQRPFAGRTVAHGFTTARLDWEQALPALVFAPDPRIRQVWEISAYHILAAMEANLPRIGAVNYPIFWIRDGVIVLRALDLIGRHDLARTGCDYLASMDFGGGFGAEADAPGEGLWALAKHAQMTGDRDWLLAVFPHLRRRVEWLRRMRTTSAPLYAMVENRAPRAYNSPASALVCLPAVNGTIHGRMDWHTPDFYINCWAVGGLREAVWAAEWLGASEATAWRAELDELEAEVFDHLLPDYGNDRDPAVTPYPTGALTAPPYHEALRARFGDWYQAHRLGKEGARRPERLWTYFEAAQIHNALHLGFKEEAWINLDGMLDDAVQPWLIAAWPEGSPEGSERLPYGNDLGARGWLQPGRALAGNMPHNWTGAEVLALLRTLFVDEVEDALVLGKGVPRSWWVPGARFGVRDIPTTQGTVSYTVTIMGDGMPHLEYSGPSNHRWVDFEDRQKGG
jgi:hypothetical protein